MLEIVFCQSAEGMLKQAMHYGEGPYRKQAIGLILDEQENGGKPSRFKIWREKQKIQKKLKKEWESAEPLGGSAADVVCFSLGLWYGSIEEPVLGEKRKQALADLFLLEKGDDAAQQRLEKIMQARDGMRRRAEEGEPIRVWYSDDPNDRCGICWLAAEMESWNAVPPVFAVKLPEFCEEENTTVHYRGWGEVGVEKLHRFLPLQQQLSNEDLHALAAEWKSAQKQNMPLRVVEQGKLQSVPADYYDAVIWQELDKQPEEFPEAHLIGAVVGRLAVSDNFVALRLEELIEQGKLQITKEETPGSRSYRRWLKKETV